jgi:hypothetical protein
MPASCKLSEVAHSRSVQPFRRGFKWEMFRQRVKAARSTERINEATADVELMKETHKSCEISRSSERASVSLPRTRLSSRLINVRK